jgi:predicted ester cyclase
MQEEANKLCVRRHFDELWNAGELEKATEFFDSNFMNFGHQYQDGIALVKSIVTVWRTAFPDLHFNLDTMIAEGDLVMCEMSLSGTHLGEFPLIPPLHGPSLAPNGKKFQIKHIHRFRLKGGKIVEHFAARDDLGMFQQLGHLRTLAG